MTYKVVIKVVMDLPSSVIIAIFYFCSTMVIIKVNLVFTKYKSYFEYANFWPKICLILYPFIGNLTTHIILVATTVRQKWQSLTQKQAALKELGGAKAAGKMVILPVRQTKLA